jgi:membrane-bound serine protease (ClpP class)
MGHRLRGRVLPVTLATLALAALQSVDIATRRHASPGPSVVVAEVDGIIHPITAEFMAEVMDHADTSGAAATIFVLRTPGGLLDSTRAIVSRMIAARAPVVMWVGPGGARAASAGFILVLAADVAAMARGTHIGAAHPVQAGGGGGDQKLSETMEKKAAEDVAAYARSLAEARRRNVTLAAQAVTESRAFTDTEALGADPPLIDLVADDLDALIRQLDGRTVRRFDGREETLSTANATVDRREMSRRQQFLSAIAHPQVAYILLSLGILGLTIELWNPGSVVPGVVGAVSLLLAFFAFQILPVSTAGVLLIVLGIGLLVLELKIPSFGILGVGGALSLVIGSIMLTDTVPGVTVGWEVVVPLAISMALLFLLLGRLALLAQRRPATTGIEGMLGAQGEALTDIPVGGRGEVAVHGEIWRAAATSALTAREPVTVVGVDGLVLTVAPATRVPSQGDTR